MSENNESGNRWEKPAEPVEEHGEATPVETVAAQPPQEPSEPTGRRRMPAWMTPRGLIATGAAAAIFLGGGGVGYAVGAHGHHDGNRDFPARFDRNGLPGGQLPGGGQAPDFQQGPQYQSDGQGS